MNKDIATLEITNRLPRTTAIFAILILSVTVADETKWISIGSLHNWYSSAGCEIEIGRTHEVSDQQDGLRWPALYRWQDCQAARALWIGAANYSDPLLGNMQLESKVVHVGPRGPIDEKNEFMPVAFRLYGKFNHPTVVVDGMLASHTVYMDQLYDVDNNLPADRMLYNEVNTSLGITMKRRIYASSQQYHDNYFIHDYVFKNTGIYNQDGDRHNLTLTDVVFLFNFRLAISREMGLGGLAYLPQSASWGHNTMNHVMHPAYGDSLRAFYAWHGRHSACTFDNIGGPYISGDGHLGAAQFPGVVTLHADRSATDKSDDPWQPANTPYLNSGASITRTNNQFNPVIMNEEYALMISGHPELSHDEAVGEDFPDQWRPISQSGYSQCLGYGPYSLAPGDSIRIVFAEGVNGLSREQCYEIGGRWLSGTGPFVLPNGSETDNKDTYKNAWVFTGIDSILKTFARARANWASGFNIPEPPPPPDVFEVASGGDRIELNWSANAESWPNFAGYRIYRAMHSPDTAFDLLFECGAGTGHPEIVNTYNDRTAQRGFDYYYYIITFDDGSTNTLEPGIPLQSNLFWTRTIEPAYLRRPAGRSLAEIRIVPNPYNVKAVNLQFGSSAPDRIMFYGLPPLCTIRIFTENGDLVATLEHTDRTGDEAWNLVTSSRQVVVSGLYIAHFETPEGASATRKFVVVR